MFPLYGFNFRVINQQYWHFIFIFRKNVLSNSALVYLVTLRYTNNLPHKRSELSVAVNMKSGSHTVYLGYVFRMTLTTNSVYVAM
jgi:hypothetical protein